MADYSGNVWHIYPNDAPGNVGYTTPSGGPVFIRSMTWRPDTSTAAGDVLHLRDGNARRVFFRERQTGEADLTLQQEVDSRVAFRDLYLEAMDSGVLDVYVE